MVSNFPNYKRHFTSLLGLCRFNIYIFLNVSGGTTCHNPHTLVRVHLQQYINSSVGSLEGLMKLLNETYEPLYSLSKLPTTPQLGVMYSRPQIPVQTFVLVPHSIYHVRVVYCSVYCLDITFQPDGLISIRDGAYSQFDKTTVLGDFSPTQGLKVCAKKSCLLMPLTVNVHPNLIMACF